MNSAGAIIVGFCAIYIGWYYWNRLEEIDAGSMPLKFKAWATRGVALPLIVLSLGASGAFSGFPPLVEQVRQLLGITNFWVAYIALLAVGLGIVGTYFCAITLVWVAAVIAQRMEQKMDFVTTALFWSVLTLPICAFIVWVNGWPALGAGLSAVLAAIVANTIELVTPQEVVLNYSSAEASIKFGNYDQAEISIINQLEKAPTDFDGWMKLAELYAKNFQDFGMADQTIRDLVEQPVLSQTQISVALETLSAWQINLAKNIHGARSALQLLIQKLPGTHFAKMAELSLRNLPKDENEMAERQKQRKIRLPALREEPETAVVSAKGENLQDAVEQTNRCVQLLTQNPNDVAARERFAILLAERLDKPEAGVEQLRLLLDVSSLSETKRPEVLSLIAAWQLKLLKDKQAAGETCRRIIRDHPQTPYAFAAQRRLNLLEMEEKFSKTKAAGETPAEVKWSA